MITYICAGKHVDIYAYRYPFRMLGPVGPIHLFEGTSMCWDMAKVKTPVQVSKYGAHKNTEYILDVLKGWDMEYLLMAWKWSIGVSVRTEVQAVTPLTASKGCYV